MSTLSDEAGAIAKEVLAQLLPTLEAAAKAAVANAAPVAAVVVDPLIDAVDAYIAKLLGNTTPVVTASLAPADRLTAVEKHVAALTVATGHATTSSMVTAKLATAALPEPDDESVTDPLL